MAERIIRSGVDKYTIQVNTDGEIVLNVGDNGKVTISGDLDVLGDTTTIGSSELTVDDKTITINNGDPGGDGGITDLLDGYDRSAGVIIYRGSDAFDARMFYDEDLSTIRSGAKPDSTEGAFVFKLGNGNYSGIHASSIMTDTGEDLYLVGQGTGVVTAFGVTDYEKQIWNYDGANINFLAGQIQAGKEDSLINAQGVVDYINDYHLNFYQEKIEKDDSRVEIFDADIDGGTSRVEVEIDGSLFSTFYDTRVEFGNLRFTTSAGVGAITSNGINENIILKGSGSGQVQIDGWQNFTVELDPASPPAQGTTIYSKTLGDGGTGLYFINEDGTTDEFVSRNKALLYSIIF